MATASSSMLMIRNKHFTTDSREGPEETSKPTKVRAGVFEGGEEEKRSQGKQKYAIDKKLPFALT